ncbi:MAG: AI-2E family transporter [Pasteurellaceae bacterium]|nr:AI-2E family transporter [Pasteurellaceae bacterium]
MKTSFNAFLIGTAALVIILAGIKLSVEIIVPFLLALFIAIICSPIINFMTARKVPHWLAIVLLFVLILLVFFFLFGLINNTVREFTASIPQYKILLAERISSLKALAEKWNLPFVVPQETLLNELDPSSLMNFVSRLLLNFSNVVSNAFVLILVVIFMLLEAPTAKRKFALAMSRSLDEVNKEERHIDRILQSVIRYLGVKSLICFLTGFSIWLLLQFAGVQYAILWATLCFLFNYIPNIGAIIAAIPIILQTFLLNGFPTGFGVTIGILILNMLIGNVLEPKLMGRSLGLSTLVIFLSLLFWGWLLGTVGMLLSIPLTMVIKIALESNPNTLRYAALLGDVSILEDSGK